MLAERLVTVKDNHDLMLDALLAIRMMARARERRIRMQDGMPLELFIDCALLDITRQSKWV